MVFQTLLGITIKNKKKKKKKKENTPTREGEQDSHAHATTYPWNSKHEVAKNNYIFVDTIMYIAPMP